MTLNSHPKRGLRRLLPCHLMTCAIFGAALAFLTVACGEEETTDEAPVIELSVRLVEKNQYNAFAAAHDAYRSALSRQPGVGAHRMFNSFFSSSTNTVPGQRLGVVELTVFDSQAAYRAALGAVAESTVGPLSASSTVESQILVRQPDGSVDLRDFDGASIEIAVRQVAPLQKDTFDSAQAAFLGPLEAIAGTKTVEFQMIDAPANTTAGYSTYVNQDALNNTLTYYTSAQEAFTFFGSFELVSSQFAFPMATVPPIQIPSSFNLNETAAPEDIVVHNHKLYVSDIATGSILTIDLFNQAAGATVFVAPQDPSAPRPSSWGLRIDEARNRLIANYNPNYGFDGNVTSPCEVRAYDLSTGEPVGAWPLPAGTVGNPVVVDNNGAYYVGDIGPDSRIIKIDPDTNTVSIWQDDETQTFWPDGSFGLGGMVFDGESAIYGVASSGNLFYRVAVNADGSPGPIERVELRDASGNVFTDYAADGMTWAGNNTLYYALNDVTVPGPNGVIFEVSLTGATSGTIAPFQTGIKDPSGVFATTVLGQPYLFVNESQLGHAFGVDEGSPDVPFRVLSFPR